MIKKTENCLYCGEKMESKTAKKKFCSDLHRVYWNREKRLIELAKNAIPESKSKNTYQEISFKVPHPKIIKSTQKEMPDGLDRLAKMRWIRENS